MNRSNFLKEIEKDIQKKWGKNAFEADAPEKFGVNNKNKFFVTFPFPYTNGLLHCGHVFSLLKADVMARYYRTRGSNVLFTLGIHGTGIPITASANKLKNELATVKGKQYQSMVKMDIPESDIPKFSDPKYWLEYFPKIAVERDLPSLGCAIDYRRCFVTTDINPYFDSFVRWQFNKLNEKAYLKFGKKMVIYSTKDEQPCSDADRVIGEGVELKEYKIAFVPYGDSSGYFVTYDKNAPKDSFIKSTNFNPFCFNIGYQSSEKSPIFGDSISPTRGYCHKIYFMYAPDFFYENLSHQTVNCKTKWVASIYNFWNRQNKFAMLDELIIHHFDGIPTTEISHASGIYVSNPDLEWFSYYEPASEVVSRSGDRCIAAETDQWYILYDTPEWKESVYDYVSSNVTFTDQIVRELMLETIRKSHPWPFSRTVGMGTKIPFSEKYLIDSLSDSTIYMAYYTVSHLVGSIPKEKLSDDIWNSIFFGTNTEISNEYPDLFRRMTNEFRYWYPVDLRVSGKDLITNHLTMMFFNHMAIFGPELMPKKIYANGHIMINGEKMAKSKGNFITLNQAVNEYGTDVTRFIASMAGDDTNDANFIGDDANMIVLALYAEIQNWEKVKIDELRNSQIEFIDQLQLIKLNGILSNVVSAYKEMKFRDVVKYGFYELRNIRNKYQNPHQSIYKLFQQLELAVMAPITPHWAEYLSTIHNIPISFPTVTIDSIYPMDQMEWLYDYLQILELKVSAKIKKIKKKKLSHGNITINKCSQIINLIMKYDTTNKEEKKELLKNYGEKKNEVISAIELLTHMDKLSYKYGKNNIAKWLQEEYKLMMESYLNFTFQQFNFSIKYSDEAAGDPLNPEIKFS